ncbi:ketoreductase [Pseudohyphozyma bogoriensis]|nr:ketoreductase [Pseudohyphozyma bogoriensis]
MSPAPEFALITGVSGFLGCATALVFLERGVKVRGTVRSVEKANAWRAKYPQYGSDMLELVIVKDIGVAGAFDDAIKGVTRVVHTASPFHFANATDLITPALEGTKSILKAASKEPLVKSVVVTSSTAAVFDRTKGFNPGYIYTGEDWNPCSLEEALKETNPILAYVASKTLAEKAAWDFMNAEKPRFTLSTICPSVILGPALQPLASLSELNQSAKSIWGLVDAPAVPPTFAPSFVDVRDCALAHYEASFRPEAAMKRYLLVGGVFNNVLIASILRSSFPDHAARIPKGGSVPGDHYGWDCSPAEVDLGLEFTSLENSVRDAGAQLFAAEKLEAMK